MKSPKRSGASKIRKPKRNLDAMNKFLLRESDLLAELLTGHKIKGPLNADLAQFRNLNADHVALLDDGSILHVEFQTKNDEDLAFRMKVYANEIRTQYKDVPLKQVVIKLNGQPGIQPVRRSITHDYFELVIDDDFVEKLMKSKRMYDILICGFYTNAEKREAIRLETIERIKQLPRAEMPEALSIFGVIAGYVGDNMSERVISKLKELMMQKDLTIKGNPILEPIFEEGVAIGEARGKAEGIIIGEARGMAKAFGAPDEVIEAIGEWPADDLDNLVKLVEEARSSNDWSGLTDRRTFKI